MTTHAHTPTLRYTWHGSRHLKACPCHGSSARTPASRRVQACATVLPHGTSKGVRKSPACLCTASPSVLLPGRDAWHLVQGCCAAVLMLRAASPQPAPAPCTWRTESWHAGCPGRCRPDLPPHAQTRPPPASAPDAQRFASCERRLPMQRDSRMPPLSSSLLTQRTGMLRCCTCVFACRKQQCCPAALLALCGGSELTARLQGRTWETSPESARRRSRPSRAGA